MKMADTFASNSRQTHSQKCIKQTNKRMSKQANERASEWMNEGILAI